MDMLPVPNLFLISVTDSTSSRDIGSFFDLKPSKSLKCIGGISWINFEYFLYVSNESFVTALCNKCIVLA